MVWDFLTLKGAEGDFNRSPHLTFAVSRLNAEALLTVPDSLKAVSRRRMVDLGRAGFFDLIREVMGRLKPTIANCDGMEPRLRIMQRHWLTRSGPPVLDAMLNFDPRTAFEDAGNGVKYQPQWLDAAYAGLSNKNGNMQLQLGAFFPYARCDATRSRDLLDRMAETWIACQTLLAELKPA